MLGAACAAVVALDATLRRFNRARPEDERFRFSYGIGYGDVIELEGDVFGLEVNVASKLGEDLGEAGRSAPDPGGGRGSRPAHPAPGEALRGRDLQEARDPHPAASPALKAPLAYLMASPASTRFRRSRSWASVQPRVAPCPRAP